jgi:hypothetical protein
LIERDLVFFKVTPLIEREYTCIASTLGRSVEKVFLVYVKPVSTIEGEWEFSKNIE